jgi:hypothetical protein
MSSGTTGGVRAAAASDDAKLDRGSSSDGPATSVAVRQPEEEENHHSHDHMIEETIAKSDTFAAASGPFEIDL